MTQPFPTVGKKTLLTEYQDGLETIHDAELHWRRHYAAHLRLVTYQLAVMRVPREEILELVEDTWVTATSISRPNPRGYP